MTAGQPIRLWSFSKFSSQRFPFLSPMTASGVILLVFNRVGYLQESLICSHRLRSVQLMINECTTRSGLVFQYSGTLSMPVIPIYKRMPMKAPISAAVVLCHSRWCVNSEVRSAAAFRLLWSAIIWSRVREKSNRKSESGVYCFNRSDSWGIGGRWGTFIGE